MSDIEVINVPMIGEHVRPDYIDGILSADDGKKFRKKVKRWR